MLHSKSIGNKIADARKKINLSQAELARQISISPQAVGKWERGESMPDIITLNRLAAIFEVDLNYFSDTDEPAEATALVSEMTDKPTPVIPASKNKGERPDWNWDMSQGNWTDADFSGLKNLKEKFSSSNIKNCKFVKSELSGLLLEKNNIELCDFSDSDLRDSKIQLSNLLKNKFANCSIIDARFVKNNIEKCDFTGADFSGAEMLEVNFEDSIVTNAIWNFTMFKKTNLSKIVFTGTFQDCHFEQCGFYDVQFENATLLNTFFKYNERLKKVRFTNCTVDKLTYAFLQNNMANLSGITILE